MNNRTLFREQALVSQQGDNTGSVVFYQPLALRVLVVLLLAVFVVFLAYAAMADINQTVTVRGLLSATEGELKVYANKAGQLETLHVKNGDLVTRSQVLATLVETGFDRQGLNVHLLSQQHVDDQIAQISGRLLLNRDQRILQDSLSESRRNSLVEELALRHEEHRLALAQRDNAQADFVRLQRLNMARAISDSELEKAESTLLAMQKNVQLVQLAINAVAAQTKDLQTQRELDILRTEDEELALAFSLSQLKQRREEMRFAQSQTLLAPASGRVENLINRDGDQLNPRQPVLSIVPMQSGYKAQMFLPSRALGKVAEGDDIILVYDAFPLYEYGSFRAQVSNISSSPIDPREYLIPLEINEPVYLLDAALLASNDELPLRPGMQFSAELVVGSQSILQSILKPLRTLEGRLQ